MMKTCLIVDDDEAIVGMLAELMQRDGMRVLVATDGERALAVLRDFQVDVVLLDLAMPLVDGETVMLLAPHFLRPGARPRLVVVTANPNGPIRLGEITPDAVVHKPFDIEEIEAAVGIPEAAREEWNG